MHMKNQEIHKNLHRNKSDIRLSDIEEAPYIRPEGFNVVQSLLQYRDETQSDEKDTIKYYQDLKKEMSR